MMYDLIESVIDPPQRTLSKSVFDLKDGEYILRPDVRFKILRVWSQVNDAATTGRILIVGSITTYNYTERSDVDVNIEVLSPEEEKLQAAKDIALPNNGKELAGPHEINYYLRQDIPWDNYDGIYDVIGNKWMKGPSEAGVNVDHYLASFEKIVDKIDFHKAHLLQDLAEYRYLRDFDGAAIEKANKLANAKLIEINNEIGKLNEQYLEIWWDRTNAFKNTDIDRLEQYGRKNALPENVIYLLLRKYCYLHFLHHLKMISVDGVEHQELPDVVDAYGEFDRCDTPLKKEWAELDLGAILEGMYDDYEGSVDSDDIFGEHFTVYGEVRSPFKDLAKALFDQEIGRWFEVLNLEIKPVTIGDQASVWYHKFTAELVGDSDNLKGIGNEKIFVTGVWHDYER